MLLCIYSYSCATNSPEEKKLFKTKEFHYIVYDEAHKLKNMTSQTFEVFSNFNVGYHFSVFFFLNIYLRNY